MFQSQFNIIWDNLSTFESTFATFLGNLNTFQSYFVNILSEFGTFLPNQLPFLVTLTAAFDTSTLFFSLETQHFLHKVLFLCVGEMDLIPAGFFLYSPDDFRVRGFVIASLTVFKKIVCAIPL